MKPDRTSPDKETPSEHPSVDEVVDRLDKLWSRDAHTVADDSLAISLDQTGNRVGRYELRQIVGRGAFGVVYRARDIELGRDVALKLPRPDVLVDAERLKRFQGEAATAAALDHQAIVPIYEADFSGPTPYIASAYCTGPDLGQWLSNRTTPVSAEEAAEFVAKLADAVHYAHEQGVVHRDLKPSNIMLEPLTADVSESLADYEPRLTDFGLAKLVEVGLQDTRSSLMIGTPLYMAPEQLATNAQRISSATDVYALGVLLFELLTLKAPFEGKSYIEVLDKLRTEDPINLKELNPEIPTDVQTICAKCLEKESDQRFASAGELRDELRRYLDGEPLHARAATWRDRFARWSRHPQRLVGVGKFTFYVQVSILVWLLGILLVARFLPVFPEETEGKTIVAFCLVSFSFHLPKAWLGRCLAAGATWAFWPSAISSALLFALFVFAAVGPANPFEFAYPTWVSKVNTFVAFIIAGAFEVGFHMLALPAWLRGRADRH